MKFTIVECHGRFIVESDQRVADSNPPRYMRLTTRGTLDRTGGRWDDSAEAERAVKRFHVMAG
jgi:hypothetical protein